MTVLSFYIIGCILSLLVFDIQYYEKCNKERIYTFGKSDIMNLSKILLSWLYLIFFFINNNTNTNIIKK